MKTVINIVHMKTKTFVGSLAIILLLAAGCNKAGDNSNTNATSNSNENTSTSTKPRAVNVTIQNYSFSPAAIKIKKGTTVTWTQQDTVRHDVAESDGQAGGPKGPLLSKGETYSFTFNTVGTFHYHCQPHPYMQGTVEVTE